MWVYPESASTVDRFAFEITLREDLDGNGWTNGGTTLTHAPAAGSPAVDAAIEVS